MRWTSIRSYAFSFILGSTGLVVEHAGGKKRSWPNTRPAFPRGNKSSCGRQELAKAKRSELWQKLNSMVCEPAGKPLEMLQSCLNFARQELPLCGTCNYQPCAMQEGNHGKNKMSAKCLLQIICIQSINENFVNLNELAKIPT